MYASNYTNEVLNMNFRQQVQTNRVIVIAQTLVDANYSISLNQLIEADKHIGENNRSYFFTITVSNNALLSTTEHVDVFVYEDEKGKDLVGFLALPFFRFQNH